MVSASKIPKYSQVSFSSSVLILSWFGRPIPSVRCRLPLFIISMVHFSMPNSIPMFSRVHVSSLNDVFIFKLRGFDMNILYLITVRTNDYE